MAGILDDMETAFERVRRCADAAGLACQAAPSYGTPGLKVEGKVFARLKDADTLVIFAGMDFKELLLAASPEIYYETDHYRGWSSFLVRLGAIGDEELTTRLAESWTARRPKPRKRRGSA